MTQRSFDYSKWDNIELSDDESDLHPNIDKDSWFRMKHRTRLEREQREDEDVKNWTKLNEQENNRIQTITARLAGLKKLIAEGDEEAELEDQDALQGELAELKKQVEERNKKITAIQERRSWNIDNICQVKEEKTFVNSAEISSLKATDFAPTGQTEAAMLKNKLEKEDSSSSTSKSSTSKSTDPAEKSTTTTAPSSKTESVPPLPPPSNVLAGPRTDSSEKKSAISYNDYVLKHEEMLEFYSEIATLEKTEQYLVKNGGILLHEHSQSYMLLSCLEDEMNGKHKRMKQVCRQSQILSHISELAQSMGRDPRDVVVPFFRRLEEKEHKKGFDDAVKDFIKRIQERAVVKRKEMDLERENEEAPPLGPGGLCPIKTLAALPPTLRAAFESQEVANLHSAIAEMTSKEARKWMKMCVDAGLWVAQDPHEFDDPIDEDDDDEETDEKSKKEGDNTP